jgi:hypothetical protein
MVAAAPPAARSSDSSWSPMPSAASFRRRQRDARHRRRDRRAVLAACATRCRRLYQFLIGAMALAGIRCFRRAKDAVLATLPATRLIIYIIGDITAC